MGKDTNRAQGNQRRGTVDLGGSPFGKRDVPVRRPALATVRDLGRSMDAVLSTGCAILLGFTRDGGALCLTILDGELRHRSYCANDGELEQAFAAAEDYYNSRLVTS